MISRRKMAAACGLLAIVPALARAQPADDKTLASALRAGGHVILVRHGATFPDKADTDPFNLENIAAQRNLNENGKALAKAFGAAPREAGIPIGKVYTSRFNRAYETATLAGFTDIEKTTDLTEGGLVVSPNENNRRAEALRKMLATPPSSAANTLLITHKPNILDALGRDWFEVKEGAVDLPSRRRQVRSDCPPADGRLVTHRGDIEVGASPHEAAAIDHQNRTSHVGRFIRSKPQDRIRNLARIGPAPHKALFPGLALEIFARAALGSCAAQVKRRQRGARTHSVDANAVLCLLERERLRQRYDAGLGHIVLSHSGARVDRMGGRYVDDTAAPRRTQIGNGLADEPGVAHEIDRNDFFPGLAARLGERLVRANARNIDQHIDGTECFPCFGYDLARGFLPGDIADDRNDACARRRLSNPRCRLTHGVGIAVDQHHACALLTEQTACCGADPACTAGDDRRPVFKSSTHCFLLMTGADTIASKPIRPKEL